MNRCISQVKYIVLHDPIPSFWPAVCETELIMSIYILKVMHMYLIQRGPSIAE